MTDNSPHIESTLESIYSVKSGQSEALRKAILKMAERGEFMIAGIREIVISDFYFDSADYLLARNNACLRLRDIPGRGTKLTFRHHGSVTGDPSDATEVIEGPPNAEILHSILDQAPWLAIRQPDNIQLDFTSGFELLHALGVYNVFRVSFTRSIFTVISDEALYSEVSLDTGHYLKDQSSLPFHQMSIEYLSGDVTLLPNQRKKIIKQLRFIKPAKRTVYQQSLREFNLWRPEKRQNSNRFKTWRKRFEHLFARIEKLYLRAIEFENIRDLHKTRVTIRQLLTLLKFLRPGPEGVNTSTHEVRMRLKAMLKYLGRVRDYDVFIEKHQKGSLPDWNIDGLERDLIKLLELKRSEARLQVLEVTDDYFNSKLRKHWGVFIDKELGKSLEGIQIERDYINLRRRFEDSLGIYIESRELRGAIHPMTLKRLHRSRILLKELRYASEHLEFIIPGTLRVDVSQYAIIQESLGEVNDTFNLLTLYRQIASDLGSLVNENILVVADELESTLTLQMEQLELGNLLDGPDIPAYTENNDLLRIKGIGPKARVALHSVGIADITNLATLELAHLESSTALESSLIKRAIREDWIGQARQLVQH